MALQQDTVSITLAAGLSQGSDSKQIDQSKTATSEEMRILKDKKAQKRDGLQDYPTTQTSLTGTNPITIGTSDSQNWVRELNSKVLMHNKGVVYEQDPVANSWNQIAYAPNLSVTTTSVASSSYTAEFQSTASGLGYTVTATSDGLNVRLSVVRDSDLKVILKDSIIYTVSGAAFMGLVKVVPMNSTFAVLILNGSVGFIGFVLTPSTGVVGSSVTMVASAAGFYFDATWIVGSARGDRLALLTSSALATDLRLFDSSLTFDATIGAQSVFSGNATKYVGLYNDSTVGINQILCFYGFSFSGGSATPVARAIFTIGASSWSTVLASTNTATITLRATASTPRYLSMAAMIDAQDSTKINCWYSYRDSSGLAIESTPVNDITYVFTINSSTGVITTAAAVWSYGATVVAQPFNDTARLTTLVPVIVYQGTNGFAGVADFHRSRVSRRLYLVAKFSEGEVDVRDFSSGLATNRAPSLSRSWSTSAGFSFGYITVKRYINITTQLADIGANVANVQISGTTAALFENNNNLIIGGAQSYCYDGADFGEFGFSYTPLAPLVSLGSGISVNVTQQGTGALPEITIFTFGNAGALSQSGSGSYFTFQTPAVTYYVWYNFGSNSNPAPGGTGIQVTPLSDDSSSDLIYRTVTAINAAASFNVAAVALTSNTMRTLNVADGAVADATSGATDSGITSGSQLPSGTYQFLAVNLYVDKYGKTWRSRPSDITTVVTTTATSTFSAIIQTPDVTNRVYSLNSVEIYATDTNGSVFYVLTLPTSTSKIIWNGTGPRLVFKNTVNPTFTYPYSGNRQLYTTGEILENDYPTGWNQVVNFKDRVVLGFPISQSLTYSKTAASDEGLAFSNFLQIVANQDDVPISALGELDDKLIIFKAKRKFVVVGDPANDAGTGGNLSIPQALASDKGCSAPLSVVQTSIGLFYSSLNGVYLLGRDLSDKYIGKDIQDTNSQTVASVALSPNTNEIVYFFKNSSKAATFNYEYGIWTFWRNHQADFGFIGTKTYIIRANGRVLYQVPGQFKDVENGVSTAVTYLIEMPWLKLKGQQDFQRVIRAMILGEYLSSHTLQVEFWWDYDQRDAVKQTLSLSSSQIISGTSYADGTYQAAFDPMIQKCEAIKIRISDIPSSVDDAGSCTLNAVDFIVAMKKGLNRIKQGKST